jgi:hypothetical protein
MNTKKRSKLLRRQERVKEKETFNFGVFDLETDGLGGRFIIACAETEVGQYKFFYSPITLLNYILECKGYIFYAHNAAKFDFLYLATEIKALTELYYVTVIRQGEKIIGFTLTLKEDTVLDNNGKPKRNKDTIQLRDSLPLLDGSLEAASKAFAPDYVKLKGDIDFDGGEVFDPLNARHMRYLERDCDSLLVTMRTVYKLCHEMFGIYPSWTAGGTSMRAWKVTIPKGHTYKELKELDKEEFVRNAYYGGYVYPGKDIEPHNNVTSVDFNAAYAASMLEGVPTGNGHWTCEFREEYPGFYRVFMHVPHDIPFPMIGMHTQNGLLWPTGDFDTYTTRDELLFAREHGCTFEVEKGLYFEKIEFPFNEFIASCQEIEQTKNPETGKVDPGRKKLAKIMRNTLYGKFGMKRFIEGVVMTDDMPPNGSAMYDDKGNPVDGMYTVMEENDADYLLPHWAATITMRQRLRLFRGMVAVGSVHYCDTDSIKGDASDVDRAIESGALSVHQTLYGCVKNEGTFSWFQVLAPKTYHGTVVEIDDNTNSEEYGYYETHHEMKAKGAPMRELAKAHTCFLCRAARGVYDPINYTSMHSLEKTLRNPHITLSEPLHRRVSNIEKSDGWIINGTSVTPVHLSQCNAWA